MKVMTMKKLLSRILIGLIFIGVPVWALADYTIKDSGGTTQTILSFVCASTKICPAHVLIKSDGTEIGTTSNPVQVGAPSWAGGTLGAMANYGTSPGTVLVPGVNAYITNAPTVAQATAANLNMTEASAAAILSAVQGAIPAGTAIIGKVGVDQSTPGVTNGVTIAPSSASAVGIAPVVTASLESNHVIKASAGNLYDASITTGAVGGYFLGSNSTTAPTAGGGAIAPLFCVQAPANSTTSWSVAGNPPMPFSTGITLVFSTTGCLTNTASTTAFFSGRAQ